MHLVSLNIEGHKHIDTVIPFFKKEQPDVVFLQEVFQVDIPTIAAALGYHHFAFAPACTITNPNLVNHPPLGQIGIAWFSRLPTATVNTHYYAGNPTIVPEFTTDPSVIIRPVISITVDSITLAGTHFTWSDHGQTTPQQLIDLDKLLLYLDTLPPHIFVGDINAPRGKEIWTKLSSIYTDNIPPQLTSTLDPKIHRTKGTIAWVIDALFSHPRYRVDHVRVVPGVSDHCAIVADIT